VVDIKTGQQVGTQFKVDADANGALVKNLPMDLGEHPALESPCERRTAVRSWRRPSAASPPGKAEDAPDRTSQLLSLGLLLAAGEFLISSLRGRTDPLTSAPSATHGPGIPRGHGTSEGGPLPRWGVVGPPSRCRGAWGRPWPPRRARWASFPFAIDKRLEVLSGMNAVDLLKEHPGTAALPNRKLSIRPCWPCPLVLWLALAWRATRWELP
jgi:hypothetical protein